MTTLFNPAPPGKPLLIESLEGVVDGGQIPVVNSSEACWARDASSRLWVRKRELHTNWSALLAEACGYLLGKELEVRQPEGAVYYDGVEQNWSWMSLCIPAAGEHWVADMRDKITNIDEVGRMLVLDALILNEDRHPGNIMAVPDGAGVRLWAIDSGNALIGWPVDFSSAGLRPPNPQAKHVSGLPLEALVVPALACAQVAQSLSAAKLQAIVKDGCRLGGATPAEEAAIARTLVDRCHNAQAITAGYIDLLGALP